MTVAPLVLLALHTVLQRRAILRGVAQQRAREARMRGRTGATGGRVNLRRKKPAMGGLRGAGGAWR
ncbi:heme exporter protein C, cytochrome c-type biogenesis protein [Salmonella enterica subsp. enterica]|nr:heme exporter protein C, cytochrome c-type biogenesis protein [Salmonella enterica subsp. enterica]